MLTEIPGMLSVALACRISCVSLKTFHKLYLDTRLLHPESDPWRDGTGRMYILAHELSKALGHAITLQEVQAADAKLETRRKYMKAYRRRAYRGRSH